jgi:hypothetical protein
MTPEHGGAIRLVDFFPAILSPPRELAVKNLQFLWQAGLAMFLLWVPLSRESDDRLEAKIDRLLSEHGIDPAQFDYQEEEGVQAEA